MIKTFFFFGIMGLWVFYAYLGATPETRSYRVCYPIKLTVFELPNEVISRWDYNAGVRWDQWGTHIFNNCQYAVYKSIYSAPQSFTQAESTSATR